MIATESGQESRRSSARHDWLGSSSRSRPKTLTSQASTGADQVAVDCGKRGSDQPWVFSGNHERGCTLACNQSAVGAHIARHLWTISMDHQEIRGVVPPAPGSDGSQRAKVGGGPEVTATRQRGPAARQLRALLRRDALVPWDGAQADPISVALQREHDAERKARSPQFAAGQRASACSLVCPKLRRLARKHAAYGCRMLGRPDGHLQRLESEQSVPCSPARSSSSTTASQARTRSSGSMCAPTGWCHGLSALIRASRLSRLVHVDGSAPAAKASRAVGGMASGCWPPPPRSQTCGRRDPQSVSRSYARATRSIVPSSQ
jgi:hypothetical protein